MSHREKDRADFDLETFVDLFDTAMSSDNPAVQRALKNLLMIAAIVSAEDTEAGMRQGPLRRVLEDQRNIIRRLERVEEKSYPSPTTFGPVPLQPNMPTPWVVNPTVWPTPVQSPTTGIPPFPPGTIWATSNTSGGKATTQAHMSVASLDGFLDKLETKQ
jgi:hypothetical protein